ncbi:ras-related protein rab-24 [Anaeramoeba flamelloides]|uniref:Ras-related protein rab-24 n=1 Tax=Anaeramoeba flamelloides TaxID=1746091 RepID=A0ABQ8YW23_9EUKA|nr:ras-related protein rab-24 [Anaeramoeba flamelloides]
MKHNQQVDMKIVLLGNTFVGKTCLVNRFVNETFDEQKQTIGVSFGSKSITYKDQTLTLGIWDTAGQERFESISRMYYRQANVAIICYDVCDRKSFSKLQYWVDEVRENERDCLICLAGTKVDLAKNPENRKVSIDEIEKYADSIQVKYIETSAKLNLNIQKLFLTVIEDFLESETNSDSDLENLSNKNNNKKLKNDLDTLNLGEINKNNSKNSNGICC